MKIDFVNLSPFKTFLYSLVVGVSHVVMGPDHMSAIAVMVAGAKRRMQDEINIKECALQGLRWGVGHTVGLSVMTTIFMSLRNSLPISKISSASDLIVGVVMIVLGSGCLVSLAKWIKKEKERQHHLIDVENSSSVLGHPHGALPLRIAPGSNAHCEAHNHNMAHVHETDGFEQPFSIWVNFNKWRMGDTYLDSPTSAYFTGAVHGVSGLTGIVYVLPVIMLDDTLRLLLYLFGFFITSITSMTVLAGLLGYIPQSSKNISILSGVAGLAAIGSGIYFIV